MYFREDLLRKRLISVRRKGKIHINYFCSNDSCRDLMYNWTTFLRCQYDKPCWYMWTCEELSMYNKDHAFRHQNKVFRKASVSTPPVRRWMRHQQKNVVSARISPAAASTYYRMPRRNIKCFTKIQSSVSAQRSQKIQQLKMCAYQCVSWRWISAFSSKHTFSPQKNSLDKTAYQSYHILGTPSHWKQM